MPATSKPPLIRASWDKDAEVWVAESDDLPGLATEAPTVDALLDKLRVMIPELLEANDGDLPEEVPFELLTRTQAGGRLRRR